MAGLGVATAVLSSGAVAASLTGIGDVVGALCGAISTALTEVNKKIEVKEIKHSRIHALALAKRDSINISVSQELDDNEVSDAEFKLIRREMMKYGEFEESLRNPRSGRKQGVLQLDVEKNSGCCLQRASGGVPKKTRGGPRSFELKFSVSFTKS